MNTALLADPACYRARRAALAQRLRAAGGGVAIVPTAPEVMRNRDAEYDYRHDSYFYYLTGFTEPQAVLVLIVAPDRETSVLFCREKDIEREIWDGYRLGPDAAPATLGVDRAYPIQAIDTEMPRLLADQPALYHALHAEATLNIQLRRWIDAVRAQSRSGVLPPPQAHDLHRVLDDMRLFKDGHEIALMRRAGQISAAAHVRAMRAAAPGRYEYEIEAELLHEFRRHGASGPAYGSIVAGGAHACVLHYRANSAALCAGDLLLIDAGAEYGSYAGDITRTFPVNGRFSPAQRAVYEVVLAAQHAALHAVRPGRSFNAPHEAALKVIAQGLIDLGLCTGSRDEVIEAGSYRQFYMHRTSHWLGLDVHDVGLYRDHDAPVDARGERPWRTLQPGMVLTIEPGIYIRPADNVPEAYWNIGVRIEDDALVTPAACDLLSTGAPTDPADIEALMADRPAVSA